MNDNYKSLIIEKFNKFIFDELSAASGYIIIANKLKGIGSKNVIDELIEHGNEEFEHYSELIEYASNHGFIDELSIDNLDQNVIGFKPASLMDTVKFIQSLEKQAREDYKEMVKLGRENGDIELEEFFRELMADETEHYNDLQYLFGTINIGEKFTQVIKGYKNG